MKIESSPGAFNIACIACIAFSKQSSNGFEANRTLVGRPSSTESHAWPFKARDKVLGVQGIDRMTDAAFAELCAPWIEPRVLVTGNMLGHGLAQKALGMSGKLEKWELPDIDNPEVRKRLKAGLLQVSKLAKSLASKL